MTTGTLGAIVVCHSYATVTVTNWLHETIPGRNRTRGRRLAARLGGVVAGSRPGAAGGAGSREPHRVRRSARCRHPARLSQRLVHHRGQVPARTPSLRLRHRRERARTHAGRGTPPRPAARRMDARAGRKRKRGDLARAGTGHLLRWRECPAGAPCHRGRRLRHRSGRNPLRRRHRHPPLRALRRPHRRPRPRDSPLRTGPGRRRRSRAADPDG